MPKVTEEEVYEAQDQWAQAIVKIGQAYVQDGDFVGEAKAVIKELYGFDHDLDVLFKPTKCAHRQFRLKADGALSYFVGHENVQGEIDGPGYPEDGGFAIAPWINVEFANADIIEGTDHALAMGNYYFTGADGSFAKVEYTFGYRRPKSDKSSKKDGLLINLHHSSLPYNPACYE
ncbi:MAG: hypothetical protein AAF907_02995 [Planctomycetota bacterium]